MGAGGADLPHVTPISDPVVAGIFERVVELVDGAAARRSMARKVAMGFAGVFMWHARCIVSAACFLCTIRRSVGAKETATLGVHEPLAFLGAWLAEASRIATRNDHMPSNPSLAQGRKYAQRRGLM